MPDTMPANTLKTSNGNIRYHSLKLVSPYWEAVEADEKKVEIRAFDRDYRVGDYLQLEHYNRLTKTGEGKLWRRITHILIDAPYVPNGYAAMSIEPVVIE